MEALIVKNIKSLRTFLRLTQAEFAKAIGASESLISYVERADREPTAGFVLKVCQAFHISPDTIYNIDLMAEAVESCRMGASTCGAREETGE